MFYFYIFFLFFSFFRQPAFDGLCLSGSLPSIHVNTDVSNFTLRQINLCVSVCRPITRAMSEYMIESEARRPNLRPYRSV